MPITTPELENYFDEVYSRREEAEVVSSLKVSLPTGWEPKPTECHQNVDYWVAQPQNQHLKAVRGWYIAATSDSSGSTLLLVAHSLVDDGGTLYDITPIDSPSLKFLRHRGTTADFGAMQPAWSWTWWPIVTEMAQREEASDEESDYF
jgi:hypothetical protein